MCQQPRTQTQKSPAKRGRHWWSGGPRPSCPWHIRSGQAPAPPFRPPHADTQAGWCCEARQAATEGLELQRVRRPGCDACSGLGVTQKKNASQSQPPDLHDKSARTAGAAPTEREARRSADVEIVLVQSRSRGCERCAEPQCFSIVAAGSSRQVRPHCMQALLQQSAKRIETWL